MAKVTYLLGAGASCGCLPTYENFSERFKGFVIFIKSIKPSLYNNTYLSAIDKIESFCNFLINEFNYHSTPDTIAKKYYHRSNAESFEKLVELKKIMILFFMFEQCLDANSISKTSSIYSSKLTIEKRYDSFISSILKPSFKKIEILNNFNILTWNYDLQFEMSFANFSGDSLIISAKNLQSNYITYDECYSIDDFSLIHLNGVAFSIRKDNIRVHYTPYGRFYEKGFSLAEEIAAQYLSLSEENFYNRICFAWENDSSYPHKNPIQAPTLRHAMKVAEHTEILVIIGYSFPIFNREIDSQIIASMKGLKKVFIQSPKAIEQKDSFIAAFRSINSNIGDRSVFPDSSTNSFYIPSETSIPNQGFYGFR